MKRPDFVKFTPRDVPRTAIKNAPYNPRKIGAKARAALRANIEKVGLLDAIIWNERSGNVVGGHQRLAVMDSLMGTKDYLVPVSVVDLDDATEKAQNIFLNNPNAQGEFDLGLLEKMFRVEKVDHVAAGFEVGDLFQLFGESPLVEKPQALKDLSDRIREAQSFYESQAVMVQNRDDTEFYLVVVWAGRDGADRFIEMLGLPNERYIDGPFLTAVVQKALRGEKHHVERKEEIDQKGDGGASRVRDRAGESPSAEVGD